MKQYDWLIRDRHLSLTASQLSATKLERVARSISQFNTTYGRKFYAMSDSAVHQELDELEQENTV